MNPGPHSDPNPAASNCGAPDSATPQLAVGAMPTSSTMEPEQPLDPAHPARQEAAPDSGEPAQEPFDAETVRRAREIVARYPHSQSALLPMLHLVQSVEGYVSRQGMTFCAEQLGLSMAEVSAVVTFYTMYKRKPCGEHLVSVCTNALCAALGGDEIYQALAQQLGSAGRSLGQNETSGEPGTSGSLTLEHAECLAACDLAPVMQVNYEYFDNQTPESALRTVRTLQRGERDESTSPTRGPELTNFCDTELQLAGFFSESEVPLEQAVEGSSAAEETLRGAEIARQRGWNAPAMPDNAALPSLEEDPG